MFDTVDTAEAEVRRCLALAGAKDYLLTVRFSSRMSSTLGRCRSRRAPEGSIWHHEVILASRAWPLLSEADRLDTVRHEAAHAACVSLFGPAGRGHCHLWRALARRMGAAPRACSSHPGIIAAHRERFYTTAWCPTCACFLTVSRVTHRRLVAGTVRRWHRVCLQPIVAFRPPCNGISPDGAATAVAAQRLTPGTPPALSTG